MTTFTTPTRRTDRTTGLHYAGTPVRQRAVLTCGSWRRVTRRIVCGLTCALTVSSLLMPSISFAAEWVEVDGAHYTAGAAAGDGSTWTWDGADDMTLNGYNGGGIAAGGKLNVSYEGTIRLPTSPAAAFPSKASPARAPSSTSPERAP